MSEKLDHSSFGILSMEQMSLGDFSNTFSLMGKSAFGVKTESSFKLNESFPRDSEQKEGAKGGIKDNLTKSFEKGIPFAPLQAEIVHDTFKGFQTNAFDRMFDASKSDLQLHEEELSNLVVDFSDFDEDSGEPLRKSHLRKQKLESFAAKPKGCEGDLQFIVRRGVGCGSDSNSQSEIDTEDEVQAVLQSNQRERWIPRPGLEGGNSKDCLRFPTSAREGAEGSVVTSSVPGDGGGGGDGSSGHSSDTDSNPGSEYTQGSTLEILEGLKFQPSTQPTSEKAEARICPMGNENLSRESDYSSLLNQDLPNTMQDSIPEFSGLMSRFLRPTSLQLGDSLVSDDSKNNTNEQRNAHCCADGSEATDLTRQILPVVPQMEEIDFSDDQISARSSSYGVYSKQKSSISSENPFGLKFTTSISSDNQDVKEECPVYMNEEGEVVTDLAYQTDLRDQLDDDIQNNSFPSQIFEQQIFKNSFDDQFMSSDKALEILQKDEEKFEEDNKFIQADPMTSLNLGTSWTSLPIDATRQSWLSDAGEGHEEPYMRISIGQFIRARTEALGSLDDNTNKERPYFGTKVITPPRNDVPVPLIDSSSHEDEIKESNSTRIGNERETSFSENKLSLTNPSDLDLLKSYKNMSAFASHTGKDISTNSIIEETFTDRNSMMSVSTISKLIADASVSTDPLTMANAAVELSRKLMAYKLEQQKLTRNKHNNCEISSGSQVTNINKAVNPFIMSNKIQSTLTNVSNSNEVFKKPEKSVYHRTRLESGKFKKPESVVSNKKNRRDVFEIQNTQSELLSTCNPTPAAAWEALRPSSVISRVPVNDEVSQSNTSRMVRFEMDQDLYNATPSLLVLESKKTYPTSTPYYLRENISINFSQQCPSVILEETPKPLGRHCAPKSLHKLDSADISSVMTNNQSANNFVSDRFVLGTENDPVNKHSKDVLEKNSADDGTKSFCTLSQCSDSNKEYNEINKLNKFSSSGTALQRPAVNLPSEEKTSKADTVLSSYFPLTSTSTIPVITTIGSTVLSLDNKIPSVSTSNSHFKTWSVPATIISNSVINQQACSLPLNNNIVFSSSRTTNSTEFNENYNGRSSASSKISEEIPEEFSHLMDSRPLQQCASIKLPQEINFSEVCCVGIAAKCILPLQNPTSKWLKCTVQVTNFVLNGQSLPLETSTFTFKRKTVVEPNSTEEIQIVYMPRVPGSVVAQLKVSSQPFSSDKANPPNPVLHVVVLKVKAEHPQIEILTDNEHNLDFGTVAEESIMDLTLGLINTGQATVPLKLVIHENSSGWQGFYFPKKNRESNSPTVRELLTSTSLSFTMKGHLVNDKKYNVTNVQIAFRAPALNQADLPIKQFLASLNIELDSPGITNTVLDNLTLISHVGIVKLHTLTNMEPITLRSDKNKPVTVNVPLRNSGTIAPLVEVTVPKMSQLFTVSPHSLTIPPGHETSVSITYNPQGNFSKVKSLLLLRILPGGPSFEIQLIAEVISNTQENYPLVLETSLKYVTFGGVCVGNAESKSFVLKNSSPEYSANLLAYIGDENMDFWLQAASSIEKQVMRNMQFSLQPLEERAISVVFAPKQKAVSFSRIILKPLKQGKLRFTIPIQGYGGTSQLQIENVRQDSQGFYWLPLKGHLTPGTPNVQELIVKNTGERAAYVKAIVYTDFSCQQPLKASNILVSPCEFVLASGSSTKIIVALKLAANLFGSKTVATLGIYTGDEVMRTNFRKYIHKQGCGDSLLLKSGVRSINFDVPYQGEDTREEEIPSSFDDLKLFYSTMLLIRIDLRLLESNTASQVSVDKKISSTQQTDDREIKPSSPPVRESYRRQGNISESHERYPFKKWEVHPNEIHLLKGDSSSKKVQIVNNSNTNLRFQVLWPGHIIMVMPAEGCVSARSKVVLEVTSVSTTVASDDDWKGVMFIKCGEEQQDIKVFIKRKISEAISEAATTPPLHLDSTNVVFPSIQYCESSEVLLHITNISEVRQQWILSSRAPTDVMGLEDDEKSYTANYTVFKFTKLSGQIEPQKSVQIPIHFLPLNKGLFTQYWDIITKDINQQEWTIGIKLEGRGLKDAIPKNSQEVSCRRSSKSRRSGVSKCNTELPIQLEVNKLEFQETKCGSFCCLKITMNNISKSDCKVQITCSNPVFQVNHPELVIMKRRFIKLPIYFKPVNPGHYYSALTITMDSGKELQLDLSGVAVEEAV